MARTEKVKVQILALLHDSPMVPLAQRWHLRVCLAPSQLVLLASLPWSRAEWIAACRPVSMSSVSRIQSHRAAGKFSFRIACGFCRRGLKSDSSCNIPIALKMS